MLGLIVYSNVVQFVCNGKQVYEYHCLTGKSSVLLPDGSKVILHNGSSISYDESYSETNRSVSLTGEAYFDVTKDQDNEFSVFVDNLRVKVHDTSFNVSLDTKTTQSIPNCAECSVDEY